MRPNILHQGHDQLINNMLGHYQIQNDVNVFVKVITNWHILPLSEKLI